MNEYWIVTDRRTGKIIAHCGDINDAIMMVNLDPHNRFYNRQRFLVDQVIDISSTTDKQLPGQLGLPESEVQLLNSHIQRLPESQAQPIKV